MMNILPPRAEPLMVNVRQTGGSPNLLLRGLKEIGTRPRQHALTTRCRLQRLAQPPDVHLHGMFGARRRMPGSELVNEHITVNRLIRVEQQDRQQGPLLQAANVNSMTIDRDFERPQKAIFDHFPAPEHSQAHPLTRRIALTAALSAAM
jgi:hypothetical protein